MTPTLVRLTLRNVIGDGRYNLWDWMSRRIVAESKRLGFVPNGTLTGRPFPSFDGAFEAQFEILDPTPVQSQP